MNELCPTPSKGPVHAFRTMSAFAAILCGIALSACDRPPPPANATPREIAGAETTRATPSFVVRFKAPHPLAQAQDLEAAGQCEAAARLARETLAARSEFAGLCFDRFTVGGAEIVLAACEPMASREVGSFQRGWIARLRATQGVEYAEPNVTVGVAAACR